MVAKLAAVVEISGEVDYEKLDPILVEEGGRRWKLKGDGDFLVGDCVTLSGTQQDFDTLWVRAVTWNRWGPMLQCG